MQRPLERNLVIVRSDLVGFQGGRREWIVDRERAQQRRDGGYPRCRRVLRPEGKEAIHGDKISSQGNNPFVALGVNEVPLYYALNNFRGTTRETQEREGRA